MSWLIKRALTFFSGESPDTSLSARLTDVVAARDALVCILPLELVYIILDLAEYWVQVKSACTLPRAVAASNSPTHNASLCYLVTAPILDHNQHLDGEDGVRLKPVCVQFEILSRDQGWVGDDHLRSTYQGHTWFEAAILRPSRTTDPTLHSWLDGAIRGPAKMDASIGYHAALEVTSDDAKSTRWELQRNFCASLFSYSHVVTWNVEVSTTGTASGAGEGEGFVERLIAGDRIAVVARAQYPQWCNNVAQVVVTVHYALA
ncbi:hypothetical protein C8F04DRAFT_654139 [Mycena alexandri]|uniref:Uncharacterized protein n=1 Tax=Mycena alexandri TaxID=1745969 RepID=A0AAD6SRV4_9AGAR|nr:hypothetical protein C8F04DRAFT_654139 [Mycena alexandri]